MPLYKGPEKACTLAKGTQRASKMGPGIQFYCFGSITLPCTHSTNIYQPQHLQELEMQQRTRQTACLELTFLGECVSYRGEERKQTVKKLPIERVCDPGS